MAKKLRSWFFTTSSDSKINGFWQRFVGGGVSKPTQETFQNLADSAAFHTEISSAAQVDSTGALSEKSGLVILSSDINAKAGTDTALGATGGSVVPKNSNLPVVINSITNQAIREFNLPALTVETNTTGSNNKFSYKLATGFLNLLIKYLLPAISTGDGNKYVKVNAGETGYEFGVPAGGGGDIYKTVATSSLNYSTTTLGSTVALTVPAGLAYTINQEVFVIDSANSANNLIGKVLSYSGTTLSVKVVKKAGTGTSTNQNVNLSTSEIPDYTAITIQKRLVALNGVLSFVADSGVTNNQFWIAPGGNDTTGDGSINKPWKTFNFVKTKIQQLADSTGETVTLMVIGGTYANIADSVYTSGANMAIEKAGGLYYNYTINCFPGVNITQSGTSFYDNNLLNGHIDVYGSPTINGTGTLGGAYLINIATKRNGTTQTTQFHRYKNLTTNDVGSNCIKIGSTNANTSGPSVCYFSAAAVSSATSPSLEMVGADALIILQVGSASNNISGGVGVKLNGAGSVIVIDSRFANQVSGTLFKAFQVTAPPAWNVTWAGGVGAGIAATYVVKNTTFFVRAGVSICAFVDISGTGDLSAKLLIDGCYMFTEPAANSAVFVIGTSISDKLCIRDSISSADASSGSPDIVAYGTAPTLLVDTAKTFYLLPQFPF